MTRALLLLGILFFGCGDPRLGGPCKVTCDCPAMNAPINCPGEWVCNANSTCEYTCKSGCDPNGVSTCRVEEECLGTLCSSRKGCQ